MKTLELALSAETKKQKWHRLKLHFDVWIQISLYAFVLLSLFTGHPMLAFYFHYFGIGFYQVLSSQLHPVNNAFEAQRQTYDRWMVGHLLVLPALMLVFPLMFFYMITSACLALVYLHTCVCELNHYMR